MVNAIYRYPRETALTRLGHETDILEWRIQTLKCASFLEVRHETATRTAQAIEDFMAPLRFPPQDRLTQKAAGAPRDSVNRLCNDAYNLILTLRRCDDTYRCEVPKPGAKVDTDVEPLAQEYHHSTTEASHGRVASEKAVILFTIFGSLVKYPENNMAKRLVLEKAHVVIK